MFAGIVGLILALVVLYFFFPSISSYRGQTGWAVLAILLGTFELVTVYVLPWVLLYVILTRT